MRDISKVMANSVVKMFEAEGVPCGPILRKGLLTIGSADNIDINPSNRDAKDALHGTGCALTQLPTSSNTGTVRSAEQYREAARALSSIARLPQFYRDIKEVKVRTENLTAPAVTGLCRPTPSVLPQIANTPPLVPSQTTDMPESIIPQTATNQPSGDATSTSSVEEYWITHAQSLIERDLLNHDDVVSWAAFCASNLPQCDRPPCITSMLPIFRDKAQ